MNNAASLREKKRSARIRNVAIAIAVGVFTPGIVVGLTVLSAALYRAAPGFSQFFMALVKQTGRLTDWMGTYDEAGNVVIWAISGGVITFLTLQLGSSLAARRNRSRE